jgi:hypothetical protein
MNRWTLPPLKFASDFNSTLESPFCEIGGLLEFKEGFTEPEFFIHWSFMTELYGEQVFIDHCVITFPDYVALENYADALRLYNAQIIEGPGLFPVEFCPDTYTLATDLWMHFLTMLMPSGGLLVLNSPHELGDEKDRFLEERGLSAVHHVAIRVDNMRDAALLWQQKGFQPLSLEPMNGDTICQWFLENPAGQIIELINRSPDNRNTFHCQNIGELRLAEVGA